MKSRNFIMTFILLVQTVYCWITLYRAQFFPYDDNYGLMVHAFLVSLFTSFALIVVLAARTRWIKSNKVSIIVWLIVGSPISFFVASVFYESIFGSGSSNWSP